MVILRASTEVFLKTRSCDGLGQWQTRMTRRFSKGKEPLPLNLILLCGILEYSFGVLHVRLMDVDVIGVDLKTVYIVPWQKKLSNPSEWHLYCLDYFHLDGIELTTGCSSVTGIKLRLLFNSNHILILHTP